MEIFGKAPGNFDLIITDQTMPNMTGKDLAEQLFSIRPEVPVILCTGSNEKIDEERAAKVGINAFVMKPIMMNELANIIRGILDR